MLGEGLAVNPDWVDVQIGDYGGEIIYTVVHVEMKEPPFITDNREPKIQAGGIYRDWDISDDYTEVTLTLRAGPQVVRRYTLDHRRRGLCGGGCASE